MLKKAKKSTRKAAAAAQKLAQAGGSPMGSRNATPHLGIGPSSSQGNHGGIEPELSSSNHAEDADNDAFL